MENTYQPAATEKGGAKAGQRVAPLHGTTAASQGPDRSFLRSGRERRRMDMDGYESDGTRSRVPYVPTYV